MLKTKLLLFLLLGLLLSCNENEEKIISEINIKSFNIIKNGTNGVNTKTELDFLNYDFSDVKSYGVKWFKKNSTDIYKKELTNISSNYFDLSITKKLFKDSIYQAFSYVKYGSETVNSDTLNFTSLFTTPIVIDGIYPKSGFIGDTIKIKGKNFCTTDFSNHVVFNNYGGYRPVFESDSLIKVIVPSYINTSVLNLTLKTCNLSKQVSEPFKINPPVLDSIESGNKYVGDKIKLYGKNIHSAISKVWFSNIEARVIDTHYKDTLIAVIPDLLPVGKLDVKLKVLDRYLEKKDFFQSTTPYIECVTPHPLGYLDTIFVKGKYLDQKGNIPTVKIGGVNQAYIEHNSDSVKVFVNRYFYHQEPKLKFEVLNFVDEVEVTILAPKILGFDKGSYDFTDEITIKTDNFLNTSDIVIGNEGITYGDNPTINNNGEVKLSLLRWLDLTSNHSSFSMIPTGQLEIVLNSLYGSDKKNIKINPPYISEINTSSFLPGEYIKFKGKNFGYQGVCKIYIDGDLVPNPHTSAYTIYNDNIDFELNTNTSVGKHILYVEVSGQKSNVIEYEIKEVKVNSISKTTGTRKDIYVVVGENIERMDLYSNDVYIKPISKSSSEIRFKLPYNKKLDTPAYIKGVSGEQNISIGTINGIEPHDIKEDATKNISYYGYHVAGENGTDWYFVSHQGVHKFNHTTRLWENIDSNSPPFTVSYINLNHLTVTSDKLILAYGNSIHTYDLSSKSWSKKPLPFDVANGILLGDKLFAITYDNSQQFYEYNITTQQIVKYSKPTNTTLSFASIARGDNKIFVSPYQGQAYYFDLLTKSFVLIQKPNNRYSTYQSVALKYHENQLYFIGGRTDEGIKNKVYVYDLNTRSWIEKTPLLFLSKDASIHIKNNIMYIGLGYSLYSYENDDLDIYDLNVEPY